MNAKQPLNQQGREAYSGQIKNFSKERYISADWYAREWQAVWAKSWIAAVHVSDLTDSGDYVVFDLGPESILLTCNSAGTVQACASPLCLRAGPCSPLHFVCRPSSCLFLWV